MEPVSDVECGCKGIRICLICEKDEDRVLKSADETKKTVQYSYCSPCNPCWPKDVPHGEIAVRLHLGKLTLISDLTVVEEDAAALTTSNQTEGMPSNSGQEMQDFGHTVKWKKRNSKMGDTKKFPPFLEILRKRYRLQKELHDSHPVEFCRLDYSPEKPIETEIDDAWVISRSVRYTTDLENDIDELQNCIAIVVSTVGNQYVRKGKCLISEEEDEVIGAIVDFLREVRQDLGERARFPDNSAKKRTFYENTIKFIDVVLLKGVDNYTETGLFSGPDELRPSNTINLPSEVVNDIERIINVPLSLTGKDDTDFNYTISKMSRNDISNTVEVVNKYDLSGIDYLAKEYYSTLVAQLRNKIKSFVTSKTIVDADLLEAQSFSTKLSNGYNIISNLVEGIRNESNSEQIATEINYCIKSLEINVPEDNVIDGSSPGHFFKAYQAENETKLNAGYEEWAKLFQGIAKYIYESKRSIQNDVYDISEKINHQLMSDVNEMAREMEKHYYEKMKMLEIRNLPAELKRGQDMLLKMTEEIRNVTTTKELLATVRCNVNNLGIDLPIDTIQHMANRGTYFEYLQNLSEKELNTGSEEWTYPFKSVVEHIQESEQWYKFLNNLYAKFSEYEIQRDRDKYNVANVEDWGKSGKPQGIVITKKVSEQFLNKIAQYNMTDYDSVKNMTLADLQLTELNHVLNLTLKHKISTQCPEPGELVLKGDFSVGVNIDRAVEDSCKNKGQLKSIVIFISNTLFIDRDVSLFRGAIPITVIAPRWEIVGDRKITLDGLPGKSFPNKANDGVYPGNKGGDGKPGLPGGTAGTFFGIGENFVNGANLNISANGGKGGPGQNGGNGKKGNDGRNPSVPNDYCVDYLCKDNRKINGFNCSRVNCNYLQMEMNAIIEYCKYKIFGIPGGNGGDGGDGGRGGKGGNSGNIILFELNNSSEILRQRDTGENGVLGRAGKVGDGSKNGYHIIVQCYPPVWWLFRFKTRWDWADTEYNNTDNRGKIGTDGFNDRGIQSPEAAAVLQEPVNIINEYKSYLRENLNDRFKKHSLIQFLDYLENNNNVKDVYNTLGLVNELKGLEEQFQILSVDGDLDFYPFYKSLLHRISEYAQTPKQGEKSIEYKKVLNYLYTATLGRMYNLNKTSERNLVIDIYKYLETVKNDIEVLRDLQKESNKANVINKYKESYKIGVDKKIEEARNFIEKQITPEIGNISTQIDNKIDSLINETMELQKQAEKEKEQLIKKKQELQNSLEMRGLFSCFKIIGTVTSFLGPVGTVAGAVVESVSTITESLVLDKETSLQRISKLPESVLSSLKTLADQIKIVKNGKITYLNKLLDEVSQEAKKYPERLSDTSAKIADIKERLQKVKDEKFDFKEVTALEDELKQELKRKKMELKISDKKSESAESVIGKFYQVAQLGSEIYSKYKNDQSKLDALTDAIEQAEKKFQNLKQYEEKIYNTIAPMLKNMEDGLQDVASKLDAKSQVALDVTKWQVQDTLKDMKLQMQELTKGFKAKNNLVRCIEKLEDAMTTLINVYDRIQSYQEQQNLANYIADVSSTAASKILITDPILTNATNHLDIAIRSNLVLKQYKSTVDAFTQWVFPFAHRFLDNYMLPSQLELDDNIQSLVSKAMTQIENIKSKLDEYKTSVKGQDRYIYTAEFSSKYVSTKPFFVWKNEEHKDMISKLLSGKEVVVNADIMNSAPEKDAIKFSFVELYFKSQNETLQSEVNENLKGFEMSLTHLGNSHYRYDGKLHVITSDSQTIQSSFEKNVNGEPVVKNKVYDKIKAGDLMLSPYTVWEIMLINSTDLISFEQLEMYKGGIDLELTGFGSFVKRGAKVPSMTVKGFQKYNHQDKSVKSKVIDTKGNSGLIHRYFRSVGQVQETGGYMSSGTSPGLSSAINYACNFLKDSSIEFVSDIVTSVNLAFIRAKETLAVSSRNNDNTSERSIQLQKDKKESSGFTATTDSSTADAMKRGAIYSVKSECHTNYPSAIKTVNKSISLSKKESSICDTNFNKPTMFSYNFNDHYISPEPFLSNEQPDNRNRNMQFTQVPEVNSSLLLADVIARSISGRKYKSEIEESLLSPQEWISKRISDLAVQSEHDIIQPFYGLSEPDNYIQGSFLTKVKFYVKSTCEFFGFLKEENIDDYIQDIRSLFSSTRLM